MYNSESEMYSDVIDWLSRYLKGHFPKKKIDVFNTSRENLSEFLREKKLNKYFPEFETYVIKVDITAIINSNDKYSLAFVECKLNQISLKDISQLIGYSKVVLPEVAFILSPEGISNPVNSLLKIFKRHDILEYMPKHRVKVAKWDISKKEIDVATLLPPGEFI
ncbi:MAG: hypothetical protein V1833_06875 [Elusimicrobiota bacterium]